MLWASHTWYCSRILQAVSSCYRQIIVLITGYLKRQAYLSIVTWHAEFWTEVKREPVQMWRESCNAHWICNSRVIPSSACISNKGWLTTILMTLMPMMTKAHCLKWRTHFKMQNWSKFEVSKSLQSSIQNIRPFWMCTAIHRQILFKVRTSPQVWNQCIDFKFQIKSQYKNSEQIRNYIVVWNIQPLHSKHCQRCVHQMQSEIQGLKTNMR